MKQIPLTQGKVAQVDDEDFDEINLNNWFAAKTREGKFYPQRKLRRTGWVGADRTTTIARTILRARAGDRVYHIDGDLLNNCRANLNLVPFRINRY